MHQIFDNTIENSTIGLKNDGHENHVYGNTFQNCSKAIFNYNQTSNNVIYQNNFLNNGKRFLPPNICSEQGGVNERSTSNQWYSGNTGNYWSDYLELYPNANEHTQYSGIWDTPYAIPGIGSCVDQFPLMQQVTSVDHLKNDLTIPLKYELSQNYPNPFNPNTTIMYQIAKKNHVSLVIYNLKGEVVKILEDEIKPPGKYFVKWSGRNKWDYDVASGIYFFKIKTGSFSKVNKMMLIR
jgi:hypothetical protein